MSISATARKLNATQRAFIRKVGRDSLSHGYAVLSAPAMLLLQSPALAKAMLPRADLYRIEPMSDGTARAWLTELGHMVLHQVLMNDNR